MKSSLVIKSILITGAVLGWFAVIGQLVLILQNRVLTVPGTIVQFFSYFTILTNIIVALCYTFLLMDRGEEKQRFWASPKTQAGVAVYILVVGIVYNTVLRFLWAPTGMQKIIDELLHTAAPACFLLYWILFAPKDGLKWRFALDWMLFPLVYLVYVMIRGAITDMYPYPFLDAYNHGYPKVITSSLVILGLYLFLSLLIITIAKKIRPRNIIPKPML
jgi:hypothetical protein